MRTTLALLVAVAALTFAGCSSNGGGFQLADFSTPWGDVDLFEVKPARPAPAPSPTPATATAPPADKPAAPSP